MIGAALRVNSTLAYFECYPLSEKSKRTLKDGNAKRIHQLRCSQAYQAAGKGRGATDMRQLAAPITEALREGDVFALLQRLEHRLNLDSVDEKEMGRMVAGKAAMRGKVRRKVGAKAAAQEAALEAIEEVIAGVDYAIEAGHAAAEERARVVAAEEAVRAAEQEYVDRIAEFLSTVKSKRSSQAAISRAVTRPGGMRPFKAILETFPGTFDLSPDRSGGLSVLLRTAQPEEPVAVEAAAAEEAAAEGAAAEEAVEEAAVGAVPKEVGDDGAGEPPETAVLAANALAAAGPAAAIAAAPIAVPPPSETVPTGEASEPMPAATDHPEPAAPAATPAAVDAADSTEVAATDVKTTTAPDANSDEEALDSDSGEAVW